MSVGMMNGRELNCEHAVHPEPPLQLREVYPPSELMSRAIGVLSGSQAVKIPPSQQVSQLRPCWSGQIRDSASRTRPRPVVALTGLSAHGDLDSDAPD